MPSAVQYFNSRILHRDKSIGINHQVLHFIAYHTNVISVIAHQLGLHAPHKTPFDPALFAPRPAQKKTSSVKLPPGFIPKNNTVPAGRQQSDQVNQATGSMHCSKPLIQRSHFLTLGPLIVIFLPFLGLLNLTLAHNLRGGRANHGQIGQRGTENNE